MRSNKSRIVAVLAAGTMLFGAPAAMAQSEPVVIAQQGSGQVNQGNLISALNNISAQIENLYVLNDIGQIRVVNVEDVANNNNVLNNALNRNQVWVTILQDVLNNNNVLNDNVVTVQNFLNNNDVAISDVVAIDVLSGGDIVVFVQ